MRLVDWVVQEVQRGTTQTEIATGIGCSCGYLSQMLRGKSCSERMAARISAHTRGLVTIQDILYPNGLPDGAVLEAKTEAA